MKNLPDSEMDGHERSFAAFQWAWIDTKKTFTDIQWAWALIKNFRDHPNIETDIETDPDHKRFFTRETLTFLSVPS